ncbi:hypothetical protein G3A39_42370 [Paraburkholderia aspalathi]|nr:hypothetical protein [Paraburkholderia aspalathi]
MKFRLLITILFPIVIRLLAILGLPAGALLILAGALVFQKTNTVGEISNPSNILVFNEDDIVAGQMAVQTSYIGFGHLLSSVSA